MRIIKALCFLRNVISRKHHIFFDSKKSRAYEKSLKIRGLCPFIVALRRDGTRCEFTCAKPVPDRQRFPDITPQSRANRRFTVYRTIRLGCARPERCPRRAKGIHLEPSLEEGELITGGFFGAKRFELTGK